ncbi:hypothetical protein SNOG_01702 [Parastagonospora nodorum SN15]|uniref:75k gamma secalin n=1 Tax=Phaeosphaeria nodorum (strain SN15 / ATCC MYA-4574 / FGSC 10173) TaxID=321614 RepID=Q0V2R2_PHANO|nr:hypothetical protein SNOG_01702 [Parastagonospora nodorum SN15]EAT91351.2 hypothetical protein SNOG_01702 [Parastagonospora nodorum SN15]
MDPRHNQNWPPQAYNNGQYVPYPPQQQQPNAYQHQGYAPQYPPMQQQMPQGYPQSQAPQTHPHMSVSRPPSQQYPPMPQAYAQQQQQQQPRAQPQVVIPPKAPSYVSPMQHMQPPKIRHVQMPVQRNSSSGIAQADGTQDRRRYSNQQHPTPSQSKQVQRSPALQENGPRPQQKTSTLPADLSVMLLSAADEYIAAARGMGTRVVRSRREADVLQYHKLMATGLGCMDTVLRDFHLLPRDEARLRLRYATLLAEETDNTAEIDEVLSKQISLCGRCRLQDLKYASLHLQARYQFKTNHRAALKSLDKPITEAETFQHIAWVYAFRFLKVALTLQISGRIELVPALQQLHAIAAHSERRGDRAIYVACNALEALVHLRSGAADRLEQAQRAIASARSLQLQVSAEQLGSFGTLLDIIDVTCGIHNGVPDGTKSTALISGVLDEKADALQSHTGILTVVIERSSGGSMTFDSGGIFRKNPAGCDELVFVWLPKEDLQTLCFFICAYDQHVHEKGLKYIREAHHRAKSASNRHVSHSIPIPLAVAQQEWNSVLDWHSLFVIGLIACHREDAATATEALTILKKRAVKSKPNEETARTLAYLTAVSDQRNGAFESALRAYSSDLFQLPSQASSVGTKVDLAILAALNRVLIVRYPGHPQQHIATTLLKQLTPLCENHPNQYIRVAHRLVHAMSSPDTTTDASIMRKKTFVQAAVNRTSDILKKTQNREFVTMALSYFSSSFFANQVSDKAVQAVRATRHNNKWSRSPLWTAVAAGMCMHTYQQNGLLQDAQESKREYEAVMHLLPSPLRNGSDVDAEGEEEDDDLV